jgi:hypothetical protein
MQWVCITFSSVACPAVQYFSTLSLKRYDLKKIKFIRLKYVFSFSTNFVWKIYHSKKCSVRYYHNYTMYVGLQVKYPLFLSDCNQI